VNCKDTRLCTATNLPAIKHYGLKGWTKVWTCVMRATNTIADISFVFHNVGVRGWKVNVNFNRLT